MFGSARFHLGLAFLIMLALAGFPLYGDAFSVHLCSRMAVISIAVLGLNLISGFGGLVSLGHAAFLGIGAYSTGIATYHGYDSGWIHLIVAIVLSLVYGLLTGFVVLRARGGQFIVTSLAIGQMLFFLAMSMDFYGGSDGLMMDSRSDFGWAGNLDHDMTLHYAALLILGAVLLCLHILMRSPFGLIIRGIAANEKRMQALGYDSYPYLLTIYALSGVICGVAGVLLVNLEGFVSPDMMNWTGSAELVLMLILGGVGMTFGPIVGAAIFIMAEHGLALVWLHWKLIFGLMLFAFVAFGSTHTRLFSARGNEHNV